MKLLHLLLSFLVLFNSPLFAMADWWGDDIKEKRRTEIKRKQEATEELKIYARNLIVPVQHYSIIDANFAKILAKGADPNITIQNREGWQESLLSLAIPAHIAIVKALLDAGADPNTTDQLRNSVLHTASQKGSLPIAQLLIEKEANPNSINATGITPLFTAIRSQLNIQTRLELINYLLNNGADVNYISTNGATPLTTAIMNLNASANAPLEISIVKTLLNAGADPNLDSPLNLAIHFMPSAQLIALLLQAGADPNLSHKGKTPLQFAQEKLESADTDQARNTYSKIIELLENPKIAPRIAPKEKLTIKPATQKKLEDYLINQETENLKASEEFKKSAQEAAEKHLEQLKKDK